MSAPDVSSQKSRDRGRDRALWAWKQVAKIKRSGVEGSYANLARKLPSMLQVSGLGQTLAFLAAKGEVRTTAGAAGQRKKASPKNGHQALRMSRKKKLDTILSLV